MNAPAGRLRHVNVLQGSDSHPGFSTGNCAPLVAAPFGMNHWTPQTGEGNWIFDRRVRQLQGVRCTHQPSPWIGDYGWFAVLPQTGRRLLSARRRAAGFRLEDAAVHPHLFRAELLRDGTVLAFAPTSRGGIFRFDFPTERPGRVILDPGPGASAVRVGDDRRSLEGWTASATGGVPEGFRHWFVATFDREIVSWTTFSGETEHGPDVTEGEKLGIAVEFAAGGRVEMRIATSFVSPEGARRSLEREVGEASFEEIAARAEALWEEALGRIAVDEEGEDADALTVFHSCLYRTQLFPRDFWEPGEDGAPVHRSPYDGGVHPGVLVTDNGFWDTYRTVYPLFALLQPDRLATILQGWTNAVAEGGWFPQWASPGYRACMVGTHIDAVIADAVSRGVTGFDVDAALDGMLRHAREVGHPDGAWGRIGVADYLRLGWVPADRHHESAARTLDYAYDDWCIARVAAHLGRDDEGAGSRTGNYRHLWDPSVRFFRGRNADGSWEEPWDEFRWGSPFVEGGPWQSTWAVQHDPAGLAGLMGGPAALSDRLEEMLVTPPRFEVGVYGFEIHEMTEMAVAGFGQYAHSNQPVHHALWLHNAVGRPDRCQAAVRRTMDELYTPDRFPGDEDNGEMSAWYVLSALGLFPLTPGDGGWSLGAPRFRRAVVRPEGGRPEIVVTRTGGGTLAGAWNGVAAGLWLSHAALSAGGDLAFSGE